MTLILIAIIAFLMIVVERLFPANDLPKIKNWWARIALVNLCQLGLIILAGLYWDKYLQKISLLSFRTYFDPVTSSIIAYFVLTFIYYWWHRIRHESKIFWLLCHQLHHSPARIEILTSFYKHPLEIFLNSILSSLIAYTLLGCSVPSATLLTFITAIAEFFYHWNIKTPHFLGYIFQRPESHRVHHKFKHHTQNFADIPLWDIIFKTFSNPKKPVNRCGYSQEIEDRFEDMLVFRDVNSKQILEKTPLHFLPTCIGCSKRWACSQSMKSDMNDD